MFTKRFEEETNLRCHLVLDASSSMFYPEHSLNKFQFSALCSAAIINLLKKQRDAFGLTVFAEDVEILTPAKSTIAHEKYIYHQLEKYLNEPVRNKKTNIVVCLHKIAESLPRRSMIVLFSDLFDNFSNEEDLSDVFSAFQHLKFNKHEIIVFNVLEKKHELEFDFENRPYHFIDSETGDQIKLNPAYHMKDYREKMASFKNNIDIKCAQLRVDLVDAYLEDGFNPTLNAWLIKRNRMS